MRYFECEGIHPSERKGSNMTLDDIISKYRNAYAGLHQSLHDVQETGIIPHAGTEGAPNTVDEAMFSLLAMLFVTEQIVDDLTVYQMEQNFEKTASQDN